MEQPLLVQGYEFRLVTQVYSSLYIGKAGIYAFLDKRPLLIMVKTPSGERQLWSLGGKVLTRTEAIDIAPVLKDVLEPEIN